MPFQLVVLRGRSASQTIRLTEDVTTVGRQDGCTLQIRSSQVSRKHCELFEKKGLLLVKDLGSSNGTFVNGKKVADQQVLEPGAELTIGGVRFRVERAGEAAPAAPARAPGDTAVSEPITVGPEELIEVGADELVEIVDDETTSSASASEPTIQASRAAKPAPEPETGETAAAADLSEDAVAGFLLDLDIDDDDK